MKAIKYVPNTLSIMRMALSVALLFLTKMPWVFTAVYLASGITDLFDGKIARRYHIESDFGSKLDTFADLALFLAAIVCVGFLAKLKINVLKCLIPVSICLYHKCINLLITRLRFNTWNMLHTILSRNIGGALYFCVPIFLLMGEINFYVILGISALGCLVFVEETVTLLLTDEYDVNNKGYMAQKVLGKWMPPKEGAAG